MIYIDYVNGMHGRFLHYCLNALNPNFYKQDERIFSHIGTINNIFEPLVADSNHYSAHNQITPNDSTVTITGLPEDELLVELLYWHRVNEYNFDLYNLNENFYNKIAGTYLEGIIEYFKNYGCNPVTNKNIPKNLLRQYFKEDRKASNRVKLLNPNSACKIYFRRLYSYESFIKVLLEIKDTFNLPYSIDALWYRRFWEKYITYVRPILAEEQEVYFILEDIKNKMSRPIRLNLLQESWLEFFIEKQYNCSIHPTNDTYQNTKEIIDLL